jgi:hypothetical protein
MVDYKSDCYIEEFLTLFILIFFLGIQILVFSYIYIMFCLVIVNLFIDSCQLVIDTRQLTCIISLLQVLSVVVIL